MLSGFFPIALRCRVATVNDTDMAFVSGGARPTTFYWRPLLSESGAYDDELRDTLL